MQPSAGRCDSFPLGILCRMSAMFSSSAMLLTSSMICFFVAFLFSTRRLCCRSHLGEGRGHSLRTPKQLPFLPAAGKLRFCRRRRRCRLSGLSARISRSASWFCRSRLAQAGRRRSYPEPPDRSSSAMLLPDSFLRCSKVTFPVSHLTRFPR